MARNPAQWFDRCVRIDGYVAHYRFYSDVAGLYAANASNSSDRLNDGWLGLYVRDSRSLRNGFRRATVVGMVQSCDRSYEQALAAAEPDSMIMMIGYCHYYSGLTLRRATIRQRGRASFYRQAGEAARAAFGDLVAADPNDVPESVRGLAARFLTAFRARDLAALRHLVGPWSDSFDNSPELARRYYATLLGGPGSPLQALRSQREPQQAYFHERQSRDDAEIGQPTDWHICFCRRADCTNLWPISSIDSGGEPTRPYVCFRAIGNDGRRQPPDRLAISWSDFGSREPRRSPAAFRSTR